MLRHRGAPILGIGGALEHRGSEMTRSIRRAGARTAIDGGARYVLAVGIGSVWRLSDGMTALELRRFLG